MRKAVRAVRAASAQMMQPDVPGRKDQPEWVQPDTPVKEEGTKALRAAKASYRVQLMPWYVFFAAVTAGLAVHSSDMGLGVLILPALLAGGSYMFVMYRLHWRFVLNKKIAVDRAGGKRMNRIVYRAVRAAKTGAGIGGWLIPVAATNPAGFLGRLVWLVGVLIWVRAAYLGWWQPAEQGEATDTTPRVLRPEPVTADAELDHDDDLFEDEQDDEADTDLSQAAPVAPTPAAGRPAPRRRRHGQPDGRPRPNQTLPARDLLLKAPPPPSRVNDDKRVIIQQFFVDYKLDATVVDVSFGPAIARYTAIPAPGVKVDAFEKLKKDLGRVCKVQSVKIVSPVPGTDQVGIEIPLPTKATVSLREVLESAEARMDQHPLLVALGKAVDGSYVVANLAKMPHILIAGATGAGKSVCLNTLLCSILARANADQVGMILIDPKRVELTAYEGIPHLIRPIITDPRKAAEALDWVVTEVGRRYDLFVQAKVKDIDAFNRETKGPQLRYLIVVIDELADLMMIAPKDVEDSVQRITQLARAAGVHLVLATQSPRVDVVTGVIKANVPSRLAFATSSLADSRVILDQPGAEKLIGGGDGLFLPMGADVAVRFQGAFVTEPEIKDMADHWRGTAPTPTSPPADPPADPAPTVSTEDPKLLAQAIELVVYSQFGSTSMLQRKLRVGFAQAGRLMDAMERLGIVGPSEGSKARDVLVKPDDLNAALADLDDSATPEDLEQRLRAWIHNQTPDAAPQPTRPDDATAADEVLRTAQELAANWSDTGLVTRAAIIAELPNMSVKTLDAALGTLTNTDPPRLYRHRHGVYRLTPPDPSQPNDIDQETK
jgi:S-DNA-T family DNA segregation ATPase FtsK/SpoIIIE